jgi:hypothetical protein
MLRQILGIQGTSFKKIVPALYAYLFNRIDMDKFIAYVGDRKEGLRIKDIARGNGYIMKNCKLYAYACYVARKKGEKLPSAKSFEVDAYDSLLLRRLNLKNLNINHFRTFTLAEFEKVVNDMVTSSEIKNYCGKFVSKKMSFLMKSFGESREDIEAHLKEMAIVAVYKQYPRFMTHLHMLNVAKAQIHNKGHTFITASTSKSRQKLTQHEDGSFEAVHVDISTCTEVPAGPQYGAELKERLTALSQVEAFLPQRTKEFLLCAAGHYHEGLSVFMKVSNSDAVDHMSHDRYMAKVQEYFGTNQEKVDRLYENIRARIHQTSVR